MKKVLLGSVATSALVAAGSAHAADLGTRPVLKAAPMVAPVPVFSWTGCYVGAHGGWGWGKKELTQDATFFRASASPGGCFVGSFFSRTHSAGSIDTSGAIFGGQIGCDYQFSGNFVLGFQGTFAGTRMNGDGIDPNDPTDRFDVLHIRTDWIADLTARIGYSGLLPRTLVYLKGGVAWVRDRYDFRDADTLAASNVFTQNRTGWTIGGGVEYAIAPNWSIFAEFNHYDFGTKTVVNALANIPGGCEVESGGGTSFAEAFPACHDTSRIDVKQRIETVKIGVNYRFNWGKAAPVQARY